jgi:hypothetical protein
MAFGKVSLTGTVATIKQGWTAFNTLVDDLLSIANGKGASQIGVEDAADNMAAANVEDALAEIYADFAGTATLAEVFAENSSTTTGLTWGYKAGLVRFDNTITSVAAGTVSLTNNATNYIEINSSGVVSRNTTGFTSGQIPIRTVVTSAGVQTTSTDRRSWFQSWDMPLPVAKGGTGAATLTDGGILLGSGTGAITALGVAANGQIPIGDGTTDPVLATITATANETTVANGAGSITIGIADDMVVPVSVTIPNTGLHLLDTNASHDLIIKPGSDLTADKTLTVTTGDADRTITLNGNPTLNDWFDQAVKAASTPTFADVTDNGLTASKPVFSDANKKLVSTGTLPVNQGGTGATSYTNGQLLIGNTTGNTLTVATLSEGTGIDITNGTGTITIAVEANSLGQGQIANSAIGQGELKTSSGEVSQVFGGAGSANLTLPGGEYGFYPQIKTSDAGCACLDFWIGDNFIGTSYTTNIAFVAGAAVTAYAQQRYVTASGEVFWIFFLRNKTTGLIEASWASPDHPCFGNGGKPLLVPHPFGSQRPGLNIVKTADDMTVRCSGVGVIHPNAATHDFVVVNPNDSELAELFNNSIIDDEARPDLSLLQVINEQYEVDEQGGSPDWPTKAVTVGFRGTDWKYVPPGREWREAVFGASPIVKINPIKKVIPRSDYMITRTLRRKGLKEI